MVGITSRGTDASSEMNTRINTGRDDTVTTVVSAGQDDRFSPSFQSKENTSATIRQIAWNIGYADKTIGHVNEGNPVHNR